jgi:hypothetical protein
MRLFDAWVNAAETHETFHRESGMRYQVSPSPILSTNRAFSLPLYPQLYPQTGASGSLLGSARASWPVRVSPVSEAGNDDRPA